MEKLDRLGWVAGQAIRAYGARLGIRTNSAEGWAELVERFPPEWEPDSNPDVGQLLSVQFPRKPERTGVRQYYLLYDGAVRLVRTLEREELFRVFESRLHQLVAAESTDLFFHAGVVGWKGRGILLPGKTLAGKTRLVTALMRAGAEYYSDEFAVIDRQGRVLPYPKPLGVRADGQIKQESRSVSELGGTVGQQSIPVGVVIATRFKEGARWRPRRMTTGQALLFLLQHCASAQRRPELAVETVRRMVEDAVLLQGVRGEADETALRILHQMDRLSLASFAG